jgi:MbtH protein
LTDETDDRLYHVVINDEEQYSIWLDGRDQPLGWYTVGKSGEKDECLAYIDEVWSDMRPKSLRLAMEQDAAAQAPSDR